MDVHNILKAVDGVGLVERATPSFVNGNGTKKHVGICMMDD
jgi:hypothetical protein